MPRSQKQKTIIMAKYVAEGNSSKKFEGYLPKATYTLDTFMLIYDETKSVDILGKRILVDGVFAGGHSTKEDDGNDLIINEYDYTDSEGRHRFLTFYFSRVMSYKKKEA